MEIEARYGYIIGCFFFSIPWTVFFFMRPDLRKPMLVLGVLIAPISVASALTWWTIDWWRPVTLTGTIVGIEDALLGFLCGGIMAAAYPVATGKMLVRAHASSKWRVLVALTTLALATHFVISVTGATSFQAAIAALALVSAVVYIKRPDLTFPGVAAGFLTVLCSFFFYLPIIWFIPSWVGDTYLFEHLSGRLLVDIPIEEIIFWFFAGMFWSALYPYGKGMTFQAKHV